jgi:hypothetical protein
MVAVVMGAHCTARQNGHTSLNSAAHEVSSRQASRTPALVLVAPLTLLPLLLLPSGMLAASLLPASPSLPHVQCRCVASRPPPLPCPPA